MTRVMRRGGAIGLGILLSSGCYSGFNADQGSGEPTAGGSDSQADPTAGETGDESGGSSTGNDPDAPVGGAGPTPMRRLTSAQYLASARDLLEMPQWTPTTELPNDGFNEEEFQLSNMLAAGVSTTIVDYGRYRDLAKEAAEAALPDDVAMTQLLGCTPSSVTDTCARTWIGELCERAWSRPVSEGDAVLEAIVASALDGEERLGTVRAGLWWAVSSVLQSPEFLYVYPVAQPGNPSQMDDYSVARQLALTFRDSVPDRELLDLAADGELSDPVVLEAQVDRMIANMVADPEHRGAVQRFFDEWWSMNVVEHVGKDPESYPEFTETLRTAMKHEVELWIADLVFKSRDDFRTILFTDRTYVNAELAALYGIEGIEGDAFQAVELSADSHRTGLLTTGAFLSVMSHPSLTSPAARGKFVSERLLCLKIPPPPGSVDTSIPPGTKPETKRERFVRHTTDPVCAGCHVMMDPSGLALENFDAVGRYRLEETVEFDGVTHELPIDPAGDILGDSFSDGREMAELLSESDGFSQCITRQLMRQTFGREIEGDELDTAERLAETFAEHHYDFLELMRAVALHPNFTTIVPQE
ncbi:MAG: DUF1592 domain-containing protein [Nannocystaceae bacterium]|nr:DUF1592 domain-containing protein [Nannocystaceae bacterium]